MRLMPFAALATLALLVGCDNGKKPTEKDVTDFVAPKLPSYLTVSSTDATFSNPTAADGTDLPPNSWHTQATLHLKSSQPLAVPLKLALTGASAGALVAVGEDTSPELRSLAQQLADATNLGQRDPAKFSSAAQRVGLAVNAPAAGNPPVAPQIALPSFVKETVKADTDTPAHLTLLAKPKPDGGWDFVNEQSDFTPAALGQPEAQAGAQAGSPAPLAIGTDAFNAFSKKVSDLDAAMKG